MKRQRKSLLVMLAASVCLTLCASAQTFHGVAVQGNAPLSQVSAGNSSIWALDTAGNPYIFGGDQFYQHNIQSNLGLSQIAVGGGDQDESEVVWALNSSGGIYEAGLTEFGWNFEPVAGSLSQIAVGTGYYDYCHLYEVWGINFSEQIYRFNWCNGLFEEEPGLFKQLAVGGGEVWAVNGSNQIFRFDFGTHTFKQLPGVFTHVTVGPDGVWALNPAHQIYQFNPKSQSFVQLTGNMVQISAGGKRSLGIICLGPDLPPGG